MSKLNFGEKLETRILCETEGGREAQEVWERVQDRMTGEQRLMKVFELNEMARQLMRAGIAADHPQASEEELQRLYLDQMLAIHGTSLAELRRRQLEELGDRAPAEAKKYAAERRCT